MVAGLGALTFWMLGIRVRVGLVTFMEYRC